MDNYSSRTYVRIRRMVRLPEFTVVARGKMVQYSHSSRTYVRIRRMVLVSLYGVSDLFRIVLYYLDGVWLPEMMNLMLSDDTDSDDDAHDLIYVIMRYLMWL